MIKEIDVPQSGWMVTRLGAPVIAIAKAINGLRKLKFKASDKWAFTWDEGGAVIEYIPTAAVEDAEPFPWQPYASPYIGTGAAPANQGLNLMIRPGDVDDGLKIWEPSNKNIVIPVPANCTAGYRVWLDATISADATITALNYGHGTALPAALDPVFDATGTPPAHAFCLLFVVTSTATSVEYSAVDQRQSTPLSCQPTLVKVLVNGQARRMFFYSAAPTTQS